MMGPHARARIEYVFYAALARPGRTPEQQAADRRTWSGSPDALRTCDEARLELRIGPRRGVRKPLW
jgi:hypothetical protein